ncbi:MAG: right-handed parallel beta-helix repeat-containing protein [Thermoplasmata archaeon]|nr:right-handed parallel beta-helix repeat-containing protein [Thermoplasmata archaeon]
MPTAKVFVGTRVVSNDGTGTDLEVQTAIDNLPSEGGAIYIKNGIYTISSPISIPSNTSLIGAGTSTIIRLDDNKNCKILQNKDQTNGNSNILISNLKIDGNRAANMFDSWGINFRNTNDCIIEKCYISNCQSKSIDLANGSNNTIKNCICEHGTNNAISIANESSSKIIECNIRNNDFNGILIDLSTDCLCTGNHLYENKQTGIRVEASKRTVLNGNQCTNNSTGSPNTYSGIFLTPSVGNEETLYSTVIGNQCNDTQDTQTQKHGIEEAATGTDCNIIVGNMCRDNATSGIEANGINTVSANNIS